MADTTAGEETATEVEPFSDDEGVTETEDETRQYVGFREAPYRERTGTIVEKLRQAKVADNESDEEDDGDTTATEDGAASAAPAAPATPAASAAAGVERAPIRDDEIISGAVLCSGYMKKLPGSSAARDISQQQNLVWKRRYFELIDGTPRELHYYRNESKEQPLGVIRMIATAPVRPLNLRTPSHVIEIKLPRRVYYVQALSQDAYAQWLQRLSDNNLKTLISGFLLKRGKSRLHAYRSREFTVGASTFGGVLHQFTRQAQQVATKNQYSLLGDCAKTAEESAGQEWLTHKFPQKVRRTQFQHSTGLLSFLTMENANRGVIELKTVKVKGGAEPPMEFLCELPMQAKCVVLACRGADLSTPVRAITELVRLLVLCADPEYSKCYGGVEIKVKDVWQIVYDFTNAFPKVSAGLCQQPELVGNLLRGLTCKASKFIDAKAFSIRCVELLRIFFIVAKPVEPTRNPPESRSKEDLETVDQRRLVYEQLSQEIIPAYLKLISSIPRLSKDAIAFAAADQLLDFAKEAFERLPYASASCSKECPFSFKEYVEAMRLPAEQETMPRKTAALYISPVQVLVRHILTKDKFHTDVEKVREARKRCHDNITQFFSKTMVSQLLLLCSDSSNLQFKGVATLCIPELLGLVKSLMTNRAMAAVACKADGGRCVKNLVALLGEPAAQSRFTEKDAKTVVEIVTAMFSHVRKPVDEMDTRGIDDKRTIRAFFQGELCRRMFELCCSATKEFDGLIQLCTAEFGEAMRLVASDLHCAAVLCPGDGVTGPSLRDLLFSLSYPSARATCCRAMRNSWIGVLQEACEHTFVPERQRVKQAVAIRQHLEEHIVCQVVQLCCASARSSDATHAHDGIEALCEVAARFAQGQGYAQLICSSLHAELVETIGRLGETVANNTVSGLYFIVWRLVLHTPIPRTPKEQRAWEASEEQRRARGAKAPKPAPALGLETPAAAAAILAALEGEAAAWVRLCSETVRRKRLKGATGDVVAEMVYIASRWCAHPRMAAAVLASTDGRAALVALVNHVRRRTGVRAAGDDGGVEAKRLHTDVLRACFALFSRLMRSVDAEPAVAAFTKDQLVPLFLPMCRAYFAQATDPRVRAPGDLAHGCFEALTSGLESLQVAEHVCGDPALVAHLCAVIDGFAEITIETIAAKEVDDDDSDDSDDDDDDDDDSDDDDEGFTISSRRCAVSLQPLFALMEHRLESALVRRAVVKSLLPAAVAALRQMYLSDSVIVVLMSFAALELVTAFCSFPAGAAAFVVDPVLVEMIDSLLGTEVHCEVLRLQLPQIRKLCLQLSLMAGERTVLTFLAEDVGAALIRLLIAWCSKTSEGDGDGDGDDGRERAGAVAELSQRIIIPCLDLLKQLCGLAPLVAERVCQESAGLRTLVDLLRKGTATQTDVATLNVRRWKEGWKGQGASQEQALQFIASVLVGLLRYTGRHSNPVLTDAVYAANPVNLLLRILERDNAPQLQTYALDALSSLAMASKEHCETIYLNGGVELAVERLRVGQKDEQAHASLILAFLLEGDAGRQKDFIRAGGVLPLLRQLPHAVEGQHNSKIALVKLLLHVLENSEAAAKLAEANVASVLAQLIVQTGMRLSKDKGTALFQLTVAEALMQVASQPTLRSTLFDDAILERLEVVMKDNGTDAASLERQYSDPAELARKKEELYEQQRRADAWVVTEGFEGYFSWNQFLHDTLKQYPEDLNKVLKDSEKQLAKGRAEQIDSSTGPTKSTPKPKAKAPKKTNKKGKPVDVDEEAGAPEDPNGSVVDQIATRAARGAKPQADPDADKLSEDEEKRQREFFDIVGRKRLFTLQNILATVKTSQSLQTSSTGPSEGAGIMISYSWADKAVARQIRDVLRAKKLAYWMDEDHMTVNSIYEHMADAVQRCHTVVVVSSHNYEKSTNCKLELHRAQELGKKIVHCRTSPRELSGSVALILGSKLWFDFAVPQAQWQTVAETMLARMFQEEGKPLPGPSPTTPSMDAAPGEYAEALGQLEEDLQTKLGELKMQHYAPTLLSSGVDDLETLLELTEEELKDLGFVLGHVRKITKLKRKGKK